MSINEQDAQEKYAANVEGGTAYESSEQAPAAVAIQPEAVVGAVMVENVVANTGMGMDRAPSVVKDEIKIPDHFVR